MLGSPWGAVQNRQLYILCTYRKSGIIVEKHFCKNKNYTNLPQKKIHGWTVFLYQGCIFRITFFRTASAVQCNDMPCGWCQTQKERSQSYVPPNRFLLELSEACFVKQGQSLDGQVYTVTVSLFVCPLEKSHLS